MTLRTCSLVLIFTLALGPLASADPPSVAIQQQATLLVGELGSVGVFVTVVLNCGDGGAEIGNLEVAVRQGDMTSSNIDSFTPSGSRQVVEIFLAGPFTVGEASASAIMECAGLLQGMDLGRTVKISE
jgi:hypothetical protein